MEFFFPRIAMVTIGFLCSAVCCVFSVAYFCLVWLWLSGERAAAVAQLQPSLPGSLPWHSLRWSCHSHHLSFRVPEAWPSGRCCRSGIFKRIQTERGKPVRNTEQAGKQVNVISAWCTPVQCIITLEYYRDYYFDSCFEP